MRPTLREQFRLTIAEVRLSYAERLILFAVRLTPIGHPHTAIICRHVDAMADELLKTFKKERGR